MLVLDGMKFVINNIRMFRSSRGGYSLLELLVVITVIAIIASIGLVSYAGTSKKARDTKRKGDLSAIANAMEQYYAICGSTYPAPVTGKVPTSINCAAPVQTIMPTVPTDPIGAVRYNMTGGGATFSVCLPNAIPLEAEPSIPSYCVTNLQ